METSNATETYTVKLYLAHESTGVERTKLVTVTIAATAPITDVDDMARDKGHAEGWEIIDSEIVD
jgi:hypothetical protein